MTEEHNHKMRVDVDLVRQLAEMLDATGLTEVEVEDGDRKIRIARKAAAAPLMLSVPALLFSLFALTQGSNLWPLTLIIAAALGMTYLAMLWLVRWWLY